MKKSLFSVLVVGLLVAAQEKKSEDVAEKLKGTWLIVGMEAEGKKLPEEKYKGNLLTLDGTKASYKRKDKTEHATYKIDSTKTPAELDITPTEGPDKNTVMKMIFQLDGDTLKTAGQSDGKERPTSFVEKNLTIITLKREKK